MSENKTVITIYAESTPNPSVMKFVANRNIINSESEEYLNIDEAKNAPLVQKLFHFPFVKEVFLAKNFISIAKYDIMPWDEVVMEVREFIQKYLTNGGIVISEAEEGDKKIEQSAYEDYNNELKVGEVESRIIAILDEYVVPSVVSDGGNIKFISYKDGKVSVMLQGACSGCPSSMITLKQGVENLLKKMLPTLIEEVVAING